MADMYCENCQRFFDEEEAVWVSDDPSPAGVSLPSGAYHTCTCPYCGSEDVDGAVYCECCGTHIPRTRYSDFCEDCVGAIVYQFKDLRNELRLSKGLSTAQATELMNDAFDEFINNN